MLGAPWVKGKTWETLGNPWMATPPSTKKNWFCEQMMAHSELLPVSIAVAPSCSSEPWPNTPSKKILNCNKLQNSYKACHGRSSSDCKANPSVFLGPSHVSLCFTNLRRSMYVMFIPCVHHAAPLFSVANLKALLWDVCLVPIDYQLWDQKLSHGRDKNSSLLSSLMVKAHMSFMEEALIPIRKRKLQARTKKSS